MIDVSFFTPEDWVRRYRGFASEARRRAALSTGPALFHYKMLADGWERFAEDIATSLANAQSQIDDGVASTVEGAGVVPLRPEPPFDCTKNFADCILDAIRNAPDISVANLRAQFHGVPRITTVLALRDLRSRHLIENSAPGRYRIVAPPDCEKMSVHEPTIVPAGSAIGRSIASGTAETYASRITRGHVKLGLRN